MNCVTVPALGRPRGGLTGHAVGQLEDSARLTLLHEVFAMSGGMELGNEI